MKTFNLNHNMEYIMWISLCGPILRRVGKRVEGISPNPYKPPKICMYCYTFPMPYCFDWSASLVVNFSLFVVGHHRNVHTHLCCCIACSINMKGHTNACIKKITLLTLYHSSGTLSTGSHCMWIRFPRHWCSVFVYCKWSKISAGKVLGMRL